MKYRVAIRAFTLRRDIAASYVLAKLLEKRGCDVFLCCARNFDFVLREWKPHAVIINTVGKVAQAKEFAPGAKIIHWPGEGGEMYKFSDVPLLKEYGTYDDLDLLLLWGKYTKDLFVEHFGANNDKLKVCGNPRLDLTRYLPEIKIPDNTIGILGRFNCINQFDKRPTMITLMNDPDNIKTINVMCEQFVALCQVVDFILEKTDLNISWRPHPLEAPEGYYRMKQKYGKRFKVDDSYCFAHWVANQKCLLTPASTTFLESYMLGVPTINIDNLIGAQDRVRNINKITALAYEMSYNPQNMDELFDILTSDLPRNFKKVDELDEHLKDFHDVPREGSSMNESVDEIMKLLKSESFKPKLHYPKVYLNGKDWYRFSKSNLFGATNHANFNYKSGYHKMPNYYNDIVENIINENSTLKI